MGDPWAAGGQPAPPGASPCTARRGTAAACLQHLLPSCGAHLGGCRAASLTLSQSSLPAAVAQQYFPPFLKSAPLKPTQQHSLPWLWPAAGPFWSHLQLALLWHGPAAGLCSQKPPLQPLHYQIFFMWTQLTDFPQNTEKSLISKSPLQPNVYHKAVQPWSNIFQGYFIAC